MSNNENVQPNGQSTPNPTEQPIAQQPVVPQSVAQTAPNAQSTAQPVNAAPQTAQPAKPAPEAKPAQPTQPAPKAQSAANSAPEKTEKTTEQTAQRADDNNKKKKKKKRRKTDWGGRLIASIVSIILGFVIGVGSVFGTVAAIVYSVATQPVDETVELVDTITGLDITNLIFNDEDGYLSRKYLDQKLKIGDLVGEVTDAISGLSGEETSLRDVASISPFVGVKIKELVDMVNNDYGIPLEYEALLDAKITGSPDDDNALTRTLLDNFMNTQLGTLLQTFLGEDEMNPILKTLCYGKEGVDYELDENGKPKPIGNKKFVTIHDLASEGGEQVLFNLEIASLLSITEYNPEDPIHSILFKNELDDDGTPVVGADGKAVKIPVSINDLITDSEAIINSIEIAGIIGAKEYNPDDPIHSIIFKDDENGNKVPVSVGDFINDSTTIINGIEIAGIIGAKEYNPEDPIHSIIFKDDENGNKVPVSVGDFINDSTTIINGIKIADILGETTYDSTDPIHAILFKNDENGNKVPVSVGDFINDSQTIIDSIEIASIMGETEYNPEDPMHAILFKDDENGNKVPVSVGDLTGEFINNIEIAGILGETEYNAKDPMHAILFKDDENGNKVPVKIKELDGEFINNIEIAGILGATEYNAEDPMHAILFKDGVDDEGNPIKVPVTIKELNGEFINNIEIAGILGVTEYNAEDPMHAILFKDGVDDEGNPKKVPVTIKELDGEFINKIKIAEILGATEYDPENSMHAILFKTDENGDKVPVTIDELDEEFINNIEIAGILGATTYNAKDPMHAILFKDDENGNKVPVKIKELDGEFINNIEIAGILGVTEYDAQDPMHAIIFKNDENGNKVPVTIDELNGEFINNIEIAGILGVTKYDAKDPMHAIIFKNDENGDKVPVTIDELNGEFINNIEIAGILGETEYDAENSMHAILFKDGIDGEGNLIKVPVTIKELDETFINSVKLKDLIGKNSNKVFQSLLTITEEKEGVLTTRDTTIADLTNADTSKILIDSIKLSAVIEGNPNSVLQSLTTITEVINGVPTSRDTTLKDLTDPDKSQTLINSIKLEDVIETEGENVHAVLKSIVFLEDGVTSRTLADLANTTTSANIINSIKLQDVIGDNPNEVLQSLSTITEVVDNVSISRPTTLADLTDPTKSKTLINSIKLEDVIGENPNKILQSLLTITEVNEDGVSTPRPTILADLADADRSEKIIRGIKLADVLGVTSTSHKALIFLAYGSDTVDDTKARTLGNIRDAGDNLINDIPLSYIITPDLKDPILSYLIYGTKGIHYDVETKTENGTTVETVKPLQRYIAVYNQEVFNEYGEAMPDDSYTLDLANHKFTENGVTYTLTSGAKTEIKVEHSDPENDDPATVYYLVDKDGNKVMFKETTLADFSAEDNAITKLTARLTAKDVLGDDIENNAMLKFLKDTPINKLGEEVEKLTFGQVFEDQIYRKSEKNEPYVDDNGVTVNKGDYIDYDGNKLAEGEKPILGDIWHYMLTDENGNSAEFEYSIVNDMDKLMENMKREIHDATLTRLAHDKIIALNKETLETDIITNILLHTIMFKDPNDPNNDTYDDPYNKTAGVMFKNTDGTMKQKIGELTVEEIIVYVDGVLNTLKKVNG